MIELSWWGLCCVVIVAWVLGRAAGVSAGQLAAMQGAAGKPPPPELLASLLGKPGANPPLSNPKG